MTSLQQMRLLRLSGIAGILGALGWIAGDILIVGDLASSKDYPLLLGNYADRLEVDLAQHLLAISSRRLIAGALVAVFTTPFYLVACWHLWQGVKPVGRWWAVPAISLIFVGYAWSPLPHAAFYFLGAAYHAISSTDSVAHPYLLTMAAEFHSVLLATYIPAVGCLALGLFWLSAAVATGRSQWSRWFALVVNPLTIGAVTVGGPHLLSGALGIWLSSAALNTTWLLIYLISTGLLWRDR
jgi:hypothetical protein